MCVCMYASMYACMCVCMYVRHLIRVVFFNNSGCPLAEHLSGINSLVSRGDLLSVPQVQRTASHVQSRDASAGDMSEVILAARQVAWCTQYSS